jgi:hypothetical protein
VAWLGSVLRALRHRPQDRTGRNRWLEVQY